AAQEEIGKRVKVVIPAVILRLLEEAEERERIVGGGKARVGIEQGAQRSLEQVFLMLLTPDPGIDQSAIFLRKSSQDRGEGMPLLQRLQVFQYPFRDPQETRTRHEPAPSDGVWMCCSSPEYLSHGNAATAAPVGVCSLWALVRDPGWTDRSYEKRSM